MAAGLKTPDRTLTPQISEFSRRPGADVLTILYGRTGGISHVYGSLAADEMTKVKRVHLGMKPGHLPHRGCSKGTVPVSG